MLRVIKTFKCIEKITLERKKYDKSVKVKVTVLAPDKRAMVRMDETVKIFSLKKSEYRPIAYKPVIKTLDNSRAGTKR